VDALTPDLVGRARDGDARAQTVVLETVKPVFERFFTSRIGPVTEVDDLVQNTLLRVHGSFERIQDPARFKGFAMKAALFELQDYYRGRYTLREQLYDPDLPADTSHDAPAGLEMDAEKLLNALTPKARQILTLKAYGYRYEEIAETIGSTEAAVKMQVKRATEKLRGLMAGLALIAVGLLLR
jgi:RNA polymerase sigma-70 factor (ECF subfamily)